jgi:hypothetical protein
MKRIGFGKISTHHSFGEYMAKFKASFHHFIEFQVGNGKKGRSSRKIVG